MLSRWYVLRYLWRWRVNERGLTLTTPLFDLEIYQRRPYLYFDALVTGIEIKYGIRWWNGILRYAAIDECFSKEWRSRKWTEISLWEMRQHGATH